MKDSKIYSLLFFSLLLLLIASLVLLYTWGYYKFYDNKEKTITSQHIANKPNNPNGTYRDSLEKIYNSTIKSFNTSFSATKQNNEILSGDAEANPDEFYKLKKEIEGILKNNPLKADLDIARQKIEELQNKLTELNNKNRKAEIENKRLNKTLAQLATEIKSVEQKIKTDKRDDNKITKSTTPVSVFKISDLRLSAIMLTNGSEQETMMAERTEKFTGIITLSNNAIINNAEIFVVIIKPDGGVMQGSSWETGTFNTPQGRKIYSTKLSFEYSRIDNKRLTFSIIADDYQKGVYNLQVYNNGNLIGKTTKSLN